MRLRRQRTLFFALITFSSDWPLLLLLNLCVHDIFTTARFQERPWLNFRLLILSLFRLSLILDALILPWLLLLITRLERHGFTLWSCRLLCCFQIQLLALEWRRFIFLPGLGRLLIRLSFTRTSLTTLFAYDNTFKVLLRIMRFRSICISIVLILFDWDVLWFNSICLPL